MSIRKFDAEMMERQIQTKDILVQARVDHNAEDLDASLSCVRCTVDDKLKKHFSFEGEKKFRMIEAHQNGTVLNVCVTGMMYCIVVRWDVKEPFRAVYWGESERILITQFYRNQILDRKPSSSWEY